jgi:hypothetical protein
MGRFYVGWTAHGVSQVDASDIFEAADLAATSIRLSDARGLDFDVKSEPIRSHFDFVGEEAS